MRIYGNTVFKEGFFQEKKKPQYIMNNYIFGLAKTLVSSLLLTGSGTHQVRTPFQWLVEMGYGRD